MTSKFVSAGSTDDLVQTSDEWEKAKKDIEETRRRKEQEGRQEGGKSLYEVLQQNKGRSLRRRIASALSKLHRIDISVAP